MLSNGWVGNSFIFGIQLSSFYGFYSLHNTSKGHDFWQTASHSKFLQKKGPWRHYWILFHGLSGVGSSPCIHLTMYSANYKLHHICEGNQCQGSPEKVEPWTGIIGNLLSCCWKVLWSDQPQWCRWDLCSPQSLLAFHSRIPVAVILSSCSVGCTMRAMRIIAQGMGWSANDLTL